MKETLSGQKSPQDNFRDSRTLSSAGPNGMALTPPAYGIDFLDQGISSETTDAGSIDVATNMEVEDQDVLYQDFRVAAFRLGSETHHVVLKTVGDETVVGIESDFKTLESIEETLLKLAGEAGHELEDEEDDIKDLFTAAKDAKARFDRKEAAMRKAKKALERFGRLPPKAPPPDVKAYNELKTRKHDARGQLTVAELELARQVVIAIEAAWVQYGEFLGPTLMPIGFVFRERDFVGDTSQHAYFTGADATHAIPIVWYKAPADYLPVVTADGKEHTLAGTAAGAISVGAKKLGVDKANQPDNAAFVLRKVAHDGDRTGQKEFNDALNKNGAGVKLNSGTIVLNALGPGGFDGDHVKDLGFNGSDSEDNYWPLLARINRRAFNGYNSGYIVNYVNDKAEHKSKSIGGLIGKYFRVKTFIPSVAGAVPAESGTRYAGTVDIKP